MLHFTIHPFEVHGKKENAMQTLKIKTHRMPVEYETHHFYLLSKGYNAGKPLDKPCPNCFVIHAISEREKEKLFWICYCLWKSGKYIPMLVGSVIPFIHIRDIEREIKNAAAKASQQPQLFSKLVNQFQAFHRLEKQLDVQTKMISRIKGEMARSFFK